MQCTLYFPTEQVLFPSKELGRGGGGIDSNSFLVGFHHLISPLACSVPVDLRCSPCINPTQLRADAISYMRTTAYYHRKTY